MHKRILFLFVLLPVFCTSAKAQSQTGTTSIFTNKVVANDQTAYSNDTIKVENVTVVPNGKLTLIGAKGVTIEKEFEVEFGGSLNIYGGKPFAVEFRYDAYGNRILRKKK